MPYARKEDRVAQQKRWYLAHREEALAADAARRRGRTPEEKDAYLAYLHQWQDEHRAEINEKGRKQWHIQSRDEKSSYNDRRRLTNTEKWLWLMARRRAKEKGLEFSIEVSDIVIPESCPLLGIKIDVHSPPRTARPSLDRIDPSRGYVKGNVWVVSYRANRIKNDGTPEELMKIALAVQAKAREK